jgi:GntR family transcriptional repressor for pyruvate dehydrogenase complex
VTQNGVLTPIAKTRAYEQAAEQISARIQAGVWQPGDRLPSERDLALQLGISRGSTREALRVLEAMGWLAIRPGDGIIVRDRTAALSGATPEQLLAGVSVEVGDLWEVRKLIEPGAAYLAAERGGTDELAAIEDVLNRTEAHVKQGGRVELERANPDFHMAVAWASGNAMIAHVQRMLVGAELRAMQLGKHEDRTPEQVTKTLAEHRHIFEEIRAGRAKEAERAAFDHLITSWMATWKGARR